MPINDTAKVLTCFDECKCGQLQNLEFKLLLVLNK